MPKSLTAPRQESRQPGMGRKGCCRRTGGKPRLPGYIKDVKTETEKPESGNDLKPMRTTYLFVIREPLLPTRERQSGAASTGG